MTLIVGFAAWLVYKQQKQDTKQDAANILLLEIQSAERAIKKIEELVFESFGDSILSYESVKDNPDVGSSLLVNNSKRIKTGLFKHKTIEAFEYFKLSSKIYDFLDA
jgi:hypothetical protein